jgi:hypothetical protein
MPLTFDGCIIAKALFLSIAVPSSFFGILRRTALHTMTTPKTVTPSVNSRVFDLCNAREERFLRELLDRSHHTADLRLREAHVLFDAIEALLGWPGTKSPAQIPAILLYWVVIYARGEHVRKEHGCDSSHTCYAHDVREILRYFMRTIEALIRDGKLLRHTDDGIFIDTFEIPAWFYEDAIRRAGN